MFEPNPGHHEEYEVYLEDQQEWIREDIVTILGNSADEWRMDGSELKVAGAFAIVDSPTDVAALKLTLTAPAVKLEVEINAVGFTDDVVNLTHCAINASIVDHDGHVKFRGRVKAVHIPHENVYETLNMEVAKFLVDAMFDLLT